MADRRAKKEAEPEAPAAAADPEPESEPEPEPVFENRAARRAAARGKGAQQPKAAGKIEPHGRRGPAQAPRSWANRRSGG
jgi:hypothetical protein